jgi:hypothetical protein
MAIVLGIHNIVRWAVVLTALFAIFRMTRGLIAKTAWGKADRLAGLFFTIALDLQMLLGLMLYFIFSPAVKTFMSNFSTAIQNQALRYWGFDHIGLMLAAVVFAHVGSAASKKELPDQNKFKRGALFYLISIVLILLGMPWFRPLLPSV